MRAAYTVKRIHLKELDNTLASLMMGLQLVTQLGLCGLQAM